MDINSFIQKSRHLLSNYFDNSESTSLIKTLLGHYLNLSSSQLIIHGNKILSEDEINKLSTGIDKLALKMPIQYITQTAYFLDLKLKVSPDVLIPRPETEELVLWILDFLKKDTSKTILDICTGSGCIALGLKHAKNEWQTLASDVSSQAIEIAKANAILNNLEIKPFTHDILLHEIPAEWNDVEAIVSNPPYIPNKEKELMGESVLKYEPEIALFVDDEAPLIFYKKIIDVSVILPKCNYCFFEINEFQSDNLVNYIESKNLDWTIKKDLNGKNRMLMVNTTNQL